MNFDAQVVALRVRACLGSEVVAVTETDLERNGRGATESRGEIQVRRLEGDPVPRPEGIECALLCFRDPAAAHHERADGAGMFDGAQSYIGRPVRGSMRIVGRPTAFHSEMPPARWAAGCPWARRCRAAVSERPPAAHENTIWRDSSGGSCVTSKVDSGYNKAPGIRSAAYSAGSRTSTRRMRPASRSSLTSSGSYSVTWSGVMCGMACASRALFLIVRADADCTSPPRSGARDQRFVAPGRALIVAVVYLRPTRRAPANQRMARNDQWEARKMNKAAMAVCFL